MCQSDPYIDLQVHFFNGLVSVGYVTKGEPGGGGGGWGGGGLRVFTSGPNVAHFHSAFEFIRGALQQAKA